MNQRFPTELRDERLNTKVLEQSKQWGHSKKEFVSLCCEFFAYQQIDPAGYDPKKEVVIQSELRLGVDLILKRIQEMNSLIAKDLAKEVLHSRLWLEALSTQFTDLLVEESSKEEVTKAILKYIKENLEEKNQ